MISCQEFAVPPTSCNILAEIQSERNMHLIKRVDGNWNVTELVGSRRKRPISKQNYLNRQPKAKNFAVNISNF